MNISSHRHIKSFDQYIQEDYNAILNSDPDPGVKIDPDFKDIDDVENHGEEIVDVEEDIIDQEYQEPSYLSSYNRNAKEAKQLDSI